MTMLLPSGWWRCDCDRTCKCPGGIGKKLNPPATTDCPGCGQQKPARPRI